MEAFLSDGSFFFVTIGWLSFRVLYAHDVQSLYSSTWSSWIPFPVSETESSFRIQFTVFILFNKDCFVEAKRLFKKSGWGFLSISVIKCSTQ